MKFLVLLSGCGLGDGSQIEEVMLTYLVLDKYGAEYDPAAVDMIATGVNHLTEKTEGLRNVLAESARIGRGRIKNLAEVDLDQYDGLIIPGGIGLLTSYKESSIVHETLQDFYRNRKPILGMCSAIALLKKHISPIIFKQFDETIGAKGYVFDGDFNTYYTPAFRASQDMYEVLQGIDSVIRAVVDD